MWFWTPKFRYLSRHVKLLGKDGGVGLKGWGVKERLSIGRLAVGAGRNQRKSRGKRQL